MSERPDVIVVGGGIAGITASIELAREGVRVLLLETRKKLGGRATSHTDQKTGETIDNCQHVALGCCTNYLRLCELLGVLDRIEWQRTIHWYEAGGVRSDMAPSDWAPAPGHYGWSLLTASFLDFEEKTALTGAMLAALACDRRRHTDRTFDDWLRERGQSRRLIERFWVPVMVSACNVLPERLCASVGLHVLQEGFLAHRDSAAMGVSRVPLVELYDRAEGVIAGAGGAMRLGTGVGEVHERHVVTTGGETIGAGRVVCALPAERAAKVIAVEDARVRAMARVEHSPILGVHLKFDRPVMEKPNAVLVGRATHWLFRKDHAGAHAHAVISGADAWMGMNEEAIVAKVLGDVHACIPSSESARVTWARAVKEKRATFVPSIEAERERPGTLGGSSLVLAGDFVQTGWPATMEGATRSGLMAASAVLGEDVRARLVPALTPAWPVRLLGGPTLRRQHERPITA
ncbi:MAG: hydroxysqualene dehydroxylase HpnE [Phycisphaerales bacterium]